MALKYFSFFVLFVQVTRVSEYYQPHLEVCVHEHVDFCVGYSQESESHCKK